MKKLLKKTILSIIAVIVIFIIIIVVNLIIFENSGTDVSVGKPIINRDRIKSALLVIDIQESLTGKLATEDYYIKKSDELIKISNGIIDSAAKFKIPVIYVKNEITNFLINILNNSLAKGSLGAEFDSRLKVVSKNIIVKDVNDAFSNPLLDSILIKNEINKLVIIGLDLAHCVKSTILAAANRKYKICLISDALLSKSDSLHIKNLDEFRKKGFEIITSKEYFASLHKSENLETDCIYPPYFICMDYLEEPFAQRYIITTKKLKYLMNEDCYGKPIIYRKIDSNRYIIDNKIEFYVTPLTTQIIVKNKTMDLIKNFLIKYKERLKDSALFANKALNQGISLYIFDVINCVHKDDFYLLHNNINIKDFYEQLSIFIKENRIQNQELNKMIKQKINELKDY